MLSGRQQPIGSLEVTYWRAYLRVRDEQGIAQLERDVAGQFAGLI